jgi:release factor glutamine methyltransferase
LVRGSLLEWLGGPVDLILANLPYLRPDQIADNPDLKAEPRLALDGGNDGLELLERVLTDAPRVLRACGAVGLEIDPAQADKILRRATQVFPNSDVTVIRDLAGLERHVIVQTGVSHRNR